MRMSMLQLILEQPKEKGRGNPISLHVRDDIPVNLFVAALVERLQFPKRKHVGTTMSYQLYTVDGGRILPGDQCLQDLHLQPGTRIYVGVDDADGSTVPVTTKLPFTSFFQQRTGRRAVLLALVTASTTGFLSGASTILAQRVWGNINGTATSPHTMHPAGQALLTTLQFRFTAHTAPVRALAWSPDGVSLSSGADDATLLLWMPDGTVRQRVTFPEAIRSLAWSPGGKRIAAGSGTAVAFVNAQNGQLIALPRAHQAAVTSIAWSTHTGSPVLSGSLDKHAIVWQTRDYRPQGSFTKHTAPIDALTATPNGGTTIASSSEGGVIRVWNLDTLQEVHGFYQDAAIAILSASFAPDGMRLAVGGRDGFVRVWGRSLICQRSVTVEGGEQHCADAPMRLQGHTGAVRAVAWSPDGRYLATGGDDAQVRVWDSAENFAQMTTLAHDAPVNALSWSPGSTLLLATGSGNSVQLWKLLIVKSQK